ncbi:MAG: immunoglobulin domain-containing protein, partial [Verrucomicrobia bacterium]|nr:immunoglobulin domain-containing protein [Verrucomicrobiota bacterium]
GALLTVTTVAAAIVTQPGNQTVPDFATATFSVSATGSGLTYQWQRRTNTTVTATYTNIPGATASSYSLVASFARDNGATFRVIVSGLVGASVTSTTATLTVNPVGPQIITQPFSIIANYGQPTNLTVVAQASGTLAYRWQRGVGATATFTNLVNGGGISGVLSPALAFNVAATANLANNGNYRVIVSSTGAGAGSVTSVVVSLTFQITPPTITAQPVSLTVIGGPTTTSVSFNVAAFGVPTPAYLWQRFDGTNWTSLIGAAGSTGAASPTLTLRPGGLNVTLRDAGSYRVVLSNLGGSVTSSVAGLTVSQTFAGAPITIPLAGGTATPYPATTAAVPPLTGAEIRHASVSMILSSDEPFDANALLVSPGALVSARKVVFMAGLGPRPTEITSLTNPELGLPHQYAVTNCALTFDDSASAPASTNYWLAPGTYQPSIHPWNLPLVPWPAPAPGLPYPMAFNALNALTAADGQWRLYVNDTVGNAGVDLAPPVGVNGSMNPWSLTLTAGPLGGPKPPPLPLAAPQTPVHLSPGNGVAGTLVTTNRPTYTFSMVDGATQYMIVLRNDVTGQYTDYAWLPAAQVDPGHTGTGSYLQPEPLGPGMYVWFVLAGNAAGMSHFDTSGLAFVTPGAGALSPVQGISPNGAVATRTPTYTFTLSSQVQQYQIQYTSVATGVSTVLGPFQTVNVAGGTIPLTGTYSIVQPTPLASGAYTWVVQSELAAGWAWSNPLPLTVP